MISIIIVNYHVKEALFVCLDSIYASKPQSVFEIIVVDNDEQKKLKNELSRRFPKVIYIKNDNKGFGQGNNVGAHYAKGEFLFFLNPDTRVEKGAIDELVSYLQKHPKVGVAAPLLYGMDGKVVPFQGARELTPLRAIFSFSLLNTIFSNNPIKRNYWYLDSWNKRSVKEVESVPGTAFVIRRTIFEKIGGFDEKFFLYFEEQDLCNRIKKLGWKLVMHPGAKVFHHLGESTKKSKKNISDIFKRSRFYYLRKHFGLVRALFAESVLRTSKYSVSLLSIIVFGAFLRLVFLEQSMPFIGDQGWFYLSARDMILNKEIPLVGIVSSHPWLHQGAFWTYLLAPTLWLGKFNPFAGAYLSIIIGLLSILGIYELGSLLFSKRFGMIAAALFAVSPLIVASDRMPYHTSPIPFFTIVALFCLYQWMRGKIAYFPFLIIILAVLYNFEIATFLLSVMVGGILFVGLLTKQFWAKKVFTGKIIFLTSLGWVFAMLPMLLYDVFHGFPQTIKILAWIGYRILVFFGLNPLNPISSVSLNDLIRFVLSNYQQLIFSSQGIVAFGIFIVGFVVLFIRMAREKEKASLLLLGFINIFLLAGLIIAKTPSAAYVPMIFPGVILLVALVFDYLIGNKKRFVQVAGVSGLLVILFFNSNFIMQKNKADTSFAQRLKAASSIVKQAGEKEYTIVGEGPESQFESFTMNYEYVTWWLGHGPSKSKKELEFILREENGLIDIKKQELRN